MSGGQDGQGCRAGDRPCAAGQPAQPRGQGLGHTVAFFKHRREGGGRVPQGGSTSAQLGHSGPLLPQHSPQAQEECSPTCRRPLGAGGWPLPCRWLAQDLGGGGPPAVAGWEEGVQVQQQPVAGRFGGPRGASKTHRQARGSGGVGDAAPAGHGIGGRGIGDGDRGCPARQETGWGSPLSA